MKKILKDSTSLYQNLCLVKQLLALLDVLVIEKQTCPELMMGSFQKVQSSGLIQISLSKVYPILKSAKLSWKFYNMMRFNVLFFQLKLLQAQPLALNFCTFICLERRKYFRTLHEWLILTIQTATTILSGKKPYVL